ncbi:MAG: flavodoxin family protein [Clostridia bacterium]|nr:flavodoxin family protein [Clostridia bacterium]
MKKTLILNGSPRVKGDTVSLIDIITKNLDGEYKIVNAYRCSVAPCIDCRYCYEKEGCAIIDGMQAIYDYIQDCDNIIIASPIYFSELTGKLLDVASRLQTYFCARHFRNENPVPKPKKGAVLLVGGGDGNMDKAYDTACCILKHINCTDVHKLIYSNRTNTRPAAEDEDVHNHILSVAEFLNN